MKSEEITEINNSDNQNKNFELAHIIGLNLTQKNSVQCHPIMSETIIYSVGGIVISEDLQEKNNQRHNEGCDPARSVPGQTVHGRYVKKGR